MLLVSPFAVILGVFTLIPLLMALVIAFTNARATHVRNLFQVDFVFLDTFTRVVRDPDFIQSLGNTGIMVVVGVPLTMGIGLALALALNDGFRRITATYRAAFYLPVITNVVAAATIWQYAFTFEGPVNTLLETFGLSGPNWYRDRQYSMALVIAMIAWRNIGTCMVIYLAGLQAIPALLYEAARVDGAGPFRTFYFVVLPMLQPTTLLITVLMTVTYMNAFDEPFLLTKGGPVGSTRSIGLWIFEQFGFGNVAVAMAGAFVLIAVVAVLSVVQFRILRATHV